MRRDSARRAPQTTLALKKKNISAFQSSYPEHLNNKISFQDDVIKSDIREIKGGGKIKIFFFFKKKEKWVVLATGIPFQHSRIIG